MTCSTNCDNPTYIWYKNSQPLNADNEKDENNGGPKDPQEAHSMQSRNHNSDSNLVMDNEGLTIESARPGNAGKYSCAVEHERHGILRSSGIRLVIGRYFQSAMIFS